MGDLAVPEDPDVRLMIDELPARAARGGFAVDQRHDIVSLGDELPRSNA